MSVVSLLGVNVLNNPAKFGDSYQFEITFECLESLQKGMSHRMVSHTVFTNSTRRSRVEVDLCWIRYLVSCHLLAGQFLKLRLNRHSDEHDQELDSLLVGPIPVGVNKFIFEADSPKTNKIPDAEILGVTVILLTCSYDSREFVRVGYYVNNEYDSEELNADPPPKPILEKVRRNILAEKPRVTRFAIKWYVLSATPLLLHVLTCSFPGTPRHLPLPSSHPISQRPI